MTLYGDPAMAKPAFWIALERETHQGKGMPDFFVGPYPTLEASEYALDNSLLIEGICTDTKKEWIITDVIALDNPRIPVQNGDNITIIDATDPYHDPWTNQKKFQVEVLFEVVTPGDRDEDDAYTAIDDLLTKHVTPVLTGLRMVRGVHWEMLQGCVAEVEVDGIPNLPDVGPPPHDPRSRQWVG